jgi:D-xylose transport system permease protein
VTTTVNEPPGIDSAKEPATPLRARIVEGLSGSYRSGPVLLALVIIWFVFYSQNHAYFSVANITNLALQIVTTAILALGLVFVLLVGEIDLSVAALSGVCATVAARLAVESGLPLGLAIVVAIATGLVVALVESMIVVFGVPSLIVTLGGSVILQGLLLNVLPPAFSVSVGGTTFAKIAGTHLSVAASFTLAAVGWGGYVVSRWHTSVRGRSVGSRSLLGMVVLPAVVAGVFIFGVVAILSHDRGLPLPVVILAVLLVLGSYLTTQTRYGAHLYAVGGNRQAAQRAGIPVARMVVYSFLILGFCGAVAGIVEASRLLGVSASSGSGPLMLNAIAAAVVGGTSLFGGRGTVWAALIGALIIGSINNGVQLLGLSTQVQDYATGLVLVVAVAIDVVVTRGSLWPSRQIRS